MSEVQFLDVTVEGTEGHSAELGRVLPTSRICQAKRMTSRKLVTLQRPASELDVNAKVSLLKVLGGVAMADIIARDVRATYRCSALARGDPDAGMALLQEAFRPHVDVAAKLRSTVLHGRQVESAVANCNCETSRSRRGGMPKQVVIGFHFVCPGEKGVTPYGDGTVWTDTWVG